MNTNTAIENWIKRADIDYYTMFIKAWIPFNAWYMKNYYDENSKPRRKHDSEIIEHLRTHPNTYRDKLINLLRDTTGQGDEFRKIISTFYYELEQHSIPNEQERITFQTTTLGKNPKKVWSFTYGQKFYKAEFQDQQPKTQKRFIVEVLKKTNQQTLHRIELFEWSLDELNQNPDFLSIQNGNVESNLKKCFDEINPSKPIVIVVPPKRTKGGNYSQPPNSFCIDESLNLYFTDDYEKVCQVIIQILYSLRCKLFHGEVIPSEPFHGIYKQAYHIQNILIKELL